MCIRDRFHLRRPHPGDNSVDICPEAPMPSLWTPRGERVYDDPSGVDNPARTGEVLWKTSLRPQAGPVAPATHPRVIHTPPPPRTCQDVTYPHNPQAL